MQKYRGASLAFKAYKKGNRRHRREVLKARAGETTCERSLKA